MRFQVHSNQTQGLILAFVWFCTLAIFARNAAAQSAKPHPWLAEAPGEFVRLIDRGNVNIVVDDDRIRKTGKSALTLFQFAVDYDFRFRHQLLGYDSEANVWQAKIVAWMDQPKIKLEHTVCVQSNFSPNLPWESKLLRHEFDHVAISTDPRFLKIVKRSLQQRRQWTGKWTQANAPTEQDVRESVLAAITAEVQSIEKLMQSQYDLLDQESSQGLTVIDSRKEFFERLYTIEGLERCKFDMDNAMRVFVNSILSSVSNQKEVEVHYLFLSP